MKLVWIWYLQVVFTAKSKCRIWCKTKGCFFVVEVVFFFFATITATIHMFSYMYFKFMSKRFVLLRSFHCNYDCKKTGLKLNISLHVACPGLLIKPGVGWLKYMTLFLLSLSEGNCSVLSGFLPPNPPLPGFPAPSFHTGLKSERLISQTKAITLVKQVFASVCNTWLKVGLIRFHKPNVTAQ